MEIVISYLKRSSVSSSNEVWLKSIRNLVLMLATIWIALATGPAYSGGRVFYDGFEDGTNNAWEQADYRNKCPVVSKALDGGSPHSGSFQAQCNWDGLVAWNDPNAFTVLRKSFPFNTDFFIRFWARRESDVDNKSGPKFVRIGFVYTMYIDFSTGQLLDDLYVDGQTNPGYGVSGAANGSWHKFEVYAHVANSGGIVRMWMDDVLVTTHTGDTQDAQYAWSPLELMGNWSNNPGWEHDSNNHMAWDDIEIYSDQGSGASGSMSDGTIGEDGVSASSNTSSASSNTSSAPPAPPTIIP